MYRYARNIRTKKEKFFCRVLERTDVVHSHDKESVKYLYTVEINTTGGKVVVHDFPRQDDGVNLYDKAYSPMWHMKDAFRHKIMIPDDMFPESFMNRGERKDDGKT
jgi:hypothetical protein